MLLNMKSLLLLGLVALTTAIPTGQPGVSHGNAFEARMAQMKDMDCHGIKFTKSDIAEAKKQAIAHLDAGTRGGSYPKKFKDYEKNLSLKKGKDYYEYPVLKNGVYNGGSPGAVRVILDDNSKFMGLLYHPTETSTSFNKC